MPGVCPGARSTTSRGSRPAGAAAGAGRGVHRRSRRRGGATPRPGGSPAAAQVLQRAARDPQQEQVEDGEEAELQADGDGFEHAVTPPRSAPRRSPARRGRRRCSGCAARRRARPLTRTPLVEPRSWTVQPPSCAGRISAWRRDTLGSSSTTSQSRLRPMTAPAAARHVAPALGDERPRGRARGGARSVERLRDAVGRRVDHRVAVVGLLGAARRRAVAATMPRLDAELAERAAARRSGTR